MSGEALTTTQWQKRCDALARRVAELEAALTNFTRDRFAMGECFCNDYWKGRDIGGHSPECLQARDALASSGGTGAAYECPRCFKQVTSENHVCYLADPGKRAGAGLREIVERAVREGWNANESGTLESIDEIAGIIVDRVLAGERDVVRRSFETLAATRDESGVAGRDVTAGKSGSHAPLVSPTTDSPAPPSREQAGRADSSASDVERARRFFNSMKPTVWPHVGEVAALAAEFAAIRREAMLEAMRIAEEEATLTNEGVAAEACRRIAMLCHRRALAGDAPAERV